MQLVLYTPLFKYYSLPPARPAAPQRGRETPPPWGRPCRHDSCRGGSTFPAGLRRFVIKGSLAGAAVYMAYDQGLLGSGTQGAEALKKAQEALPPAIQEWTNYIGWELPPTPKFDFSPSDSWNKGVQTVMSALSVAPTRACEYTVEGWKYVKELVK
ncbi:MICOS complex subunit MIC13 isoform X1 [Apteryx rowi]|uniref:MICOS complex subunit MIC13 isoform X1 n=1 Tax=Apteryx rowi TaxID=308060 RepID=UPI000E1C5131|nr:MICOS complex subunit MIC13 isoform X1 [Apteryx rowi]